MRVDEDATAEVRLPAADPEGAPLFYIVGPAAHGTVSGTAPDLTYTPARDYHGPDQLAVQVSDGELSASAVVHIEVASVNDAPVAHDDARAAAEDAAQDMLLATLLANDIDVDGDTLTITAVDTAEHGVITMADGVIRFVPDADFVGDASFEYVVSDGAADDRGRVVIAVGGVNDPPVAAADAIDTDEDTAVDVAAATLLGNDTDPEGQALEITAVGDAVGGTVSLIHGAVRFTPAADRNGAASFAYTISDGAATATATVAVTVAAVDDAPVAVADAVTTDEDKTAEIAADSLVGNDTDVEGDALAVTAVSDAVGGTVSLIDGTVRFTPAPDHSGAASFRYTVSDGTLTDKATVAVTVLPVDDAPVAVADAVTTDEDTAIEIPAETLIGNDTDLEGDALTVTAVGMAIGGTVTLGGGMAGAGGSTVRFTPAPDHNGAASFRYTVSDGELTASATVSVTIVPVNDAPVAVDDTVTTDEDTAVDVAAATLVGNDTDLEGQALTVTAVGDAVGGTVSLTGGTVRFTPAADHTGDASFRYTISDGALTASATVAVTIAAVNDAPVATDDAVTTDEDTAVDVAAATLVGNDTDTEDQALTVTVVSDAVGGTVSLVGSTVRFTPAADHTGAASFRYTVSDGALTDTATVAVTIAAVNDAPVAIDDAVTTDEDTAVDVAAATLVANDTDTEDQALTVTAVSDAVGGTASLAGGTVHFVPDADHNGDASFRYTVSDGSLTASATVAVTIAPVNDAPVAFDDTVTTDEDTAVDVAAATLLGNDADTEGQALTVTAVSDAIGGTVSLTGTTIHFTPAADQIGAASFRYTISDGALTASATVTVTIGAVNDAPVAADDAIATDEDTVAQVATSALLANDTDPEGQALTITGVAGAVGGTVSLTGGTVRFTPAADHTGAASFQYTVSDGALTDTATVTVTIAPINDAPVAVDDAVDTDEDTELVVAASALTANDTDPDGQALAITAVGNPVGGTVTLSSGMVRFTPAADHSGAGSFQYTVSDGALTDTATVAVAIAAVNDAPVAVDDAVETDEDTMVLVATSVLVANDTDADGQALTVTAVGSPVGGTVSLIGGTVRFTPAADHTGAASFQYTVSDGALADTATVAVTIAPVDDAPVAVDDAVDTDEDTDLVIPAATLLANDRDVDGTPTVIAVAPASAGTVTLVAGVVTYHPVANAHGVATFGYTISDGTATATATVTVTIAPVNDAPVAVADSASTAVNTPVDLAATALLDNDSDLDGDSLTVTEVGAASHGTVALAGGTITFTPASGFAGAASFDYTVEDSGGASATATVTVTIAGNCGDGVVAAGEQCDDGNAVSGDGCTSACIDELCGDGIINDAQARPPTALEITWLATSCGPGSELTVTINGQPALITTGDTGTCGCTPGVRTQTVTDPAALALITDGDNQVAVTMPGGMLAWLVASITVGGVAQEVVVFDAGPTGDAEARTANLCSATFESEPNVSTTVGFDLVAAEQCDDGDDSDPLDGCHACVVARCGDGVVQHTEVCDDGNAVGGDGCRADCQGEELCGDQLVDTAAGEECDDGNDSDPLDGCNACRLPACGDGALQVGEACDDGNTTYGDGCRGDCNGLEVCGDGAIDFAAGEQCDDGDDTDPADGCHACALGTIADVAPQVVSGALSCNTNTSNTGRKIASDGIANFFVVMNCGGEAWTSASTDRGTTWGAPVDTGLSGVGEVAIEGGGPLGVAYLAAVANGRVMFARSVDAGASWETAQDLGAANDNEVSIDALGDEVFIAVSTGGAIQVYRNPSLGSEAAWTSVNVAQSNVFHDVIVDKISGAVVAASDDPSFHLRISTDGGATFGAESNPAGTAFFSDWTASNGVLYVAGTSGGSDLATVIPLSAPATSTSVSGLPVIGTSQSRAIDADPLGNAYVVSQLDSGVIQLDRIRVGATAVDGADIRTFGTGTYPGVAALPNSSGAVLVYNAGSQVWVAVTGY